MILSTQTYILEKKFGMEKTLAMIKDAGFDAVDYSQFYMAFDPDHPSNRKDYIAFAEKTKKTADELGLFFNQSHAPHPSYFDGDEVKNRDTLEKIKRSIEIAGVLGVRQICVHPITIPYKHKESLEKNRIFYGNLLETAKAARVKIAVENIFWCDDVGCAIRPSECGTSELMNSFMDELDENFFTCLLDIGHCHLVGEDPAQFIKNIGKDRLGALHVHDNNGKYDMHQMPFTRNLDWHNNIKGINWDSVTRALHDIGYKGEFTFEANSTLSHYPDDFIPEVLVFMERIGRRLVSMIENPV